MPHSQADPSARRTTLADGRMVVTRRVHAPADDVWEVLADGWRYATWAVGTSRMRTVDRTWPQVGSRLRHSAGLWAGLIDETTEILACDPGRRLVLTAHVWPSGAARMWIMVNATGTHGSIVRLAQDVTDGPGRMVPRRARQSVMASRNEEALRRLALIAEARHTLELRRALLAANTDDHGCDWRWTS